MILNKTQLILFVLFVIGSSVSVAASGNTPNVLFIAIDDLRPDLSCYEETASEQMGGAAARLPIYSPAIDSIASQGTVFERAYCQVPLCGPSRVSIMTSTYPDRTGIYGMGTSYGGNWRTYAPENNSIVSLPQHFRNNGYYAASFGKIYDSRLGQDLELSWDEQNDLRSTYYDNNHSANRAAWEKFEVADNEYRDGLNTDLALDFLANHDPSTPFFLALGFAKPHLAFNAPKQYWDLYDPNDIPLLAPSAKPSGLYAETLSLTYRELETYTEPLTDSQGQITFNPITQPTSDALTRQLIHGYLACISFVDAQIQKIVNDLKGRGLYENTIIVIWGDHGFKLDDFEEWAKATTLEVDCRVPLIIRLPDSMTADRDQHAYSIIELVDVMPTICEAAGLQIPLTAQGRSLLPILKDAEAKVRQGALTQYKRNPPGMHYSVRTEDWRYTEFRQLNGTVIDQQLFDLSSLPHVETANIAATESYYSSALSSLIFDYSSSDGNLISDPIKIHFGKDNLVDGAAQSEIPGTNGTFSPAEFSALLVNTSQSSNYTSGSFPNTLASGLPGSGISFDLVVTTNREQIASQAAALGLMGGDGNNIIDNDANGTPFQESISFSLENITGIDTAIEQLFLSGVTVEFGANTESYELNGNPKSFFTASPEVILNDSASLTLKAGPASDGLIKFGVSSVQVAVLTNPSGATPASVQASQINGNNMRINLTGTGRYQAWKSRALNPPLFAGPVATGLTPGDDIIIDSNANEDKAFYIILPEGDTP